MKIACMQPYFLPYAGYFRLLRGTDLLVVLDDVQFPRRGWVHRNRLSRAGGDPGWLTLPLRKAPRAARIRELAFHENAAGYWATRLRAFPACTRPGADTGELVDTLSILDGDVVDYLLRVLDTTVRVLGMETAPMIRESSLGLPPASAPAERILALCRRLGAETYLNAPGGRRLYDGRAFAEHGVRLEFLPPWQGNDASILQRLHDSSAVAVLREIHRNMS